MVVYNVDDLTRKDELEDKLRKITTQQEIGQLAVEEELELYINSLNDHYIDQTPINCNDNVLLFRNSREYGASYNQTDFNYQLYLMEEQVIYSLNITVKHLSKKELAPLRKKKKGWLSFRRDKGEGDLSLIE
jgi:hypothetical protein